MAQADSVYVMEEVVISDNQLKYYSSSQSVQRLRDSVIKINRPSLTSLLQYNTVIYFKENGLGMVSSPSFRGTTAQQTAVIWNGININSQLNGLTDFNTITTADFDDIAVRAGGGSVIYGSSAIGGSIHLNSELLFDRKFNNEVKLDYGSFNTLALNYKLSASNKTYSTNVSISRNSSDNDYKFPGYNIRNENGQYYNTSVNVSFGYRLNEKHVLKLYSQAFEGERHFSRTVAAPSRSKYLDVNTRNLLEWAYQEGKVTSRLKAALLTEEYRYFENYRSDTYTYGNVKTYLGRYDVEYDISDGIKLNAIADYTESAGEGSDITKKRRGIGSGSLLIKHILGRSFLYEAGVRKEITNVYESPVLFSFGTSFTPSRFYALKINASRNFRIPTFNDLYWTGTGNPDLKPETSYQAEIGNVFTYKGAELAITGYYIKLDNMLRWVPGSGSIWSPENVQKANSYGVEALFKWHKSFGKNTITVQGTYAYTESHREGEREQLIYVPYHKATASVAYSFKNFTSYYTHLFTGEVFTTSDNSSKLDPYHVSNVGVEYGLPFLKGFNIGVQVLNLWEEVYENVAKRPLPGRNYNAYLNFKF